MHGQFQGQGEQAFAYFVLSLLYRFGSPHLLPRMSDFVIVIEARGTMDRAPHQVSTS